jgi:FkbH-like protein
MSMPRVTPAEITIALMPLPYAQRLAAATAFIPLLDRDFSTEAADALLRAIEPGAGGDDRDVMIRQLAALPPSPATHYLQASAAASAGDAESAAAHWSALLGSSVCRDPFACLGAARVSAQLSRWDTAALWIRMALQQHPPYLWFARAERLVDRVLAHATAPARRVRVAIAGSSTTSFMVPILRALCFREGLAADVYEGLYGAFRQEILDPDSGLARFHPDVLIVATHWRDLNLPPVVGDEAAVIDRLSADVRGLWQTASDRLGCHVVQHACDLPAFDSFGVLAQRLPGSRRRVIDRLNLRLESDLPPFASILDTARLVARVGADAWTDSRQWQLSRQHPGLSALPALAEEQLAHIKAALGLSRKVVVCDLDNTLWGGVIGEDGVDGLQVGDSPAGCGHRELQQYLRELKQRGVLLAVCSKNNPDDARLPFESHAGMVLRLDDFAAFLANWDDKVTNLRRLAETLRLGLDSFVMLDDNPLERSWIRAELPEVAVVELGPTAASYAADLDRGRYFETFTWSAEDRGRTEHYRQERLAAADRASAGSLDAFLQGLEMRGTCAALTFANIDRVVQLTNKTNQFNLTTRRYTRPQVERIVEVSGSWQGVFSLADRYGDHGIVGVLFCGVAEEADAWTIDTWLMSCRVLGRQFEEFMADAMIAAARERGIRRIYGEYRATAKNDLVAGLYPRLRFSPIGSSEGSARYALDVAPTASPYTRFVATVPSAPMVTA